MTGVHNDKDGRNRAETEQPYEGRRKAIHYKPFGIAERSTVVPPFAVDALRLSSGEDVRAGKGRH